MKQFIVLIATIPIMIIFIMQIALTNANYSKAQAVRRYVEDSKAVAKQVGYFSDDNITQLKNKIATKLDIDAGQIIVRATGKYDIKYRTNTFSESDLMYIYVEVPIEHTMAGSGYFGNKDQAGKIVVEDKVASEKLP